MAFHIWTVGKACATRLFRGLSRLCTKRERDEFAGFFASRVASMQGGPRRYAQAVDARTARKALKLSGENTVTLPMGNFDRFDAFSIGLWIKTPDRKDRAVVIHRSMAWTDAGSRGYEILIEDGMVRLCVDWANTSEAA